MIRPKVDVEVIPAMKPQLSGQIAAITSNKRLTAAYARVSTDSDEQLNSYAAQVNFYTEYIKSRADWKFVEVYTDEGLSGLTTKKRDGFKRMIDDALAGKIQLIITKSVSRFARNTVDTLQTIRDLKEKGIEVFFEKENIYTFDGKGELLISIMASLAQEESRSISDNVTWGKRRSMSDGVISLPWSAFLGYKKGKDGLPEIVEEQAEIVRQIYRLFMEGKGYTAIAGILTAQGTRSPRGNDKWDMSTVRNILTNETYRGSKRMQKTYTTNFLTKTKKPNNGELQSYYIEKSHEPIIPPVEWDAVQVEIARRKSLGRPISCQSPFSTKIICGDCGAYFGRKVWQSNTKWRQIVWRCNDRYKGENGKRDCKTSQVYEKEIMAGFVKAFSQLVANRESLLEDCAAVKAMLCDTTEIDREITRLGHEVKVVAALSREAIKQNASEAIDQDKWNELNNKYLDRHDKATKQISELNNQRTARLAKSKTLDIFIRDIEKRADVITEWDESLWLAAVESVTVQINGELTFKFKNGGEITVSV